MHKEKGKLRLGGPPFKVICTAGPVICCELGPLQPAVLETPEKQPCVLHLCLMCCLGDVQPCPTHRGAAVLGPPHRSPNWGPTLPATGPGQCHLCSGSAASRTSEHPGHSPLCSAWFAALPPAELNQADSCRPLSCTHTRHLCPDFEPGDCTPLSCMLVSTQQDI